MIVFTLNCGSSSAKYQLYDWGKKIVLCTGIVERIGEKESSFEHTGTKKIEQTIEAPSHKEAVKKIIATLLDPSDGVLSRLSEIGAVGHRLVHGGKHFTQSVIITDQILKDFEKVESLSPLHTPANILGMKVARELIPGVPHCAIIDTAWHQSMPEEAFLYALPYEWFTDLGVRRYGFHGTSYLYTAKRASLLLGKEPFQSNLIIAHIGNGASMCAVKNGISVDTSMGMTPLEGLVMGSRSGDIDPAIIAYMAREKSMNTEEIDTILNKKSGLLGVSGQWMDRRDIEAQAKAGNKRAALAQALEIRRIKKYIGAYAALLGRVDAIVFTAGVGEMGATIREGALEGLEILGVKLDKVKNKLARTRNAETKISADTSQVSIFVIPTDEELVMTEDTVALVEGRYKDHTHFSYSFEERNYKNVAREQNLKADLAKNPEIASIIIKPR